MRGQFLPMLVRRFEVLESRLNDLDAATGDGDHGSTMLKGLRAAAASPNTPGTAFRRDTGGASGTIFSLLIEVVAQAEPDSLPTALSAAVVRIKEVGGAKAGDKTMLDALIPASCANDPASAAQAARDGAETTRAMAARRGRARHVEGAGVGHLDAGAVSVAEILLLYAETSGVS